VRIHRLIVAFLNDVWYDGNMKKRKNEGPDVTLLAMTTADFAKYYNQNLPESFPRVSTKMLTEFRTGHPSLFKNEDTWTIDMHRKKLMDWLASRPR